MTRFLAVSVLISAAVACDNSGSHSHVTGKDVREAYGQAADTTKAYVSQTRDDYVAKGQRELDDVDAQIAKLRGEAKDAASDARVRIDGAIARLESQRAQVASRMDDLKNATGDAWKDMANGLDQALDDLHSSAKNAADHFKN
jgi:hypothetical protein